jgi:hypothetical protein
MRTWLVGIALLGNLAGISTSLAQNYPSRPTLAIPGAVVCNRRIAFNVRALTTYQAELMTR